MKLRIILATFLSVIAFNSYAQDEVIEAPIEDVPVSTDVPEVAQPTDNTVQPATSQPSRPPQANIPVVEAPKPTGDGKPKVRDGAYDRSITVEREILQYDPIREADVFWQKRIWRVVDTREKINKSFVYPKEPFIKILLDAAKSGEITVFSSVDDEFTTPITKEEIQNLGASTDTVWQTDPETYEEKQVVVHNEFDPTKVKKFRIKEDWIFDEETSTMVTRIIGIAPVEDVTDQNGNFRGQRAMFWVYYPDARPMLATHEAFNPFNDAIRMSWEDVLEMRYFSSYITKESNVYDRRIEDYKTGIAALLEAEKIKNDIFKFEHDLWQY